MVTDHSGKASRERTATCTASARAAILVHQFNEFKCSVEAACNARRGQPAELAVPVPPGAGAGEAMKAESVSAAPRGSAGQLLQPSGECAADFTTSLRVQPAREPLSWYTNLMNSNAVLNNLRFAPQPQLLATGPGHRSRVAFCGFPASTPMAGASAEALRGDVPDSVAEVRATSYVYSQRASRYPGTPI